MKNIATALAVGFVLLLNQPLVYATDTAQMAQNKQVVAAFYDKALNQGDAEGALAYVGSRYVQHNPFDEDGTDGFRKFIASRHAKFPHAHSYIVKIFADGDYVILHVYSMRLPDTRGDAIVDIFKLEEGKTVDHWDVVQPIPEHVPHSNTMF